jgi:serine protease Do
VATTIKHSAYCHEMIRNFAGIIDSKIISLACVALALIVMVAAGVAPVKVSAQGNAIDGDEPSNGNLSVTSEGSQQQPSPIPGSELTFRELFSQVNGSVVQITASGIPISTLPELPFGGGRQLPPQVTAIGSGFVIDKEGHVATNNHVVAHARNVSVAFSDGSVYEAKVIGSDVFADTAVLELQNVPAEKLVPLPLGNSSDLAVGDEVVAIGNPFGLTGSLSTGVVSGLGRLLSSPLSPGNNGTADNNTLISGFSIPNIIQTDAAINPGNSGGPLLNLRGEVIGMNTAILSATPFGGFSGVGFAVPSDTLKVILPALIANGSYVHPWIGVAGVDVTPEIAIKLGLDEAKGYLVIDVVMGSPADKAGIRGGDMPVAIEDGMGFPGQRNLIELGGDIILGVDNHPVNKIDDLLSYVENEKKVGDTVTLTVLRDGEMVPIEVVLGARPSPGGG